MTDGLTELKFYVQMDTNMSFGRCSSKSKHKKTKIRDHKNVRKDQNH